jgi:site-specific DNA recombinase
MHKLNSAALLCRVSTRDQEEGYSLEAQENLLREYCDRKDLDIKFVVAFSESASKYEERKKFRQFVTDVKRANILHIVVEKVDRLSRSGSRDSVLIDEWFETDSSRHIHFVKQSLDIHKYAQSTTKFVWNMHVAVAKHSSDNLSEEVLKATDTMLKKGIWPTKAPVGYLRDKANPVSPVQPDPTKAHLVQEMFKLYATGDWSTLRLADKMEEMGLRNSNNHKIMTSRIHILLQDPFYVGNMKFRGKVWEGAHEPLVNLELFDEVQRRLKRKIGELGTAHYQTHPHLLRGMSVCGGCGKLLSWEIHKGNTYGYCKRYRTCSNRISKKEKDTEIGLFPHFMALAIKNPQLADWVCRGLKATGIDRTSQQIRVRRENEENIRTLGQKCERLLELRIGGELGKEDFERKRAEYLVEIERARTVVRSSKTLHPDSELSPVEVFEMGCGALALYQNGDLTKKRELLRKLFDKIRVRSDGVSVEYTKFYDSLAKAVAVTNSSKIPKDLLLSKPNFELKKIGSENKKDQPHGVSHPCWLAAWVDFLLAVT